MTASERRPRYFNIAGPCFEGEHYMLPPERRLVEARALVDQGRWVTLVAGRQTGKTTNARWLRGHYNAGEALHAAWVDLETARGQPDGAIASPPVVGSTTNSLAFPPAAWMTAVTRRRGAPAELKSHYYDEDAYQVDMQPTHPVVNRVLHGVGRVEETLLRATRLPVGTGLISLARK